MALTAALIALGLAHPQIALPGQAIGKAAKAGKVHCSHVTAEAFREFSERTWRLPAWETPRRSAKVIQAQRGTILILDRPGLEKASCACYHEIPQQAERLLGPAQGPPA